MSDRTRERVYTLLFVVGLVASVYLGPIVGFAVAGGWLVLALFHHYPGETR